MQSPTLPQQIRETTWKRAAFVIGAWWVASHWVHDLVWRLPGGIARSAELRPLTRADAGTLEGWLTALNRLFNGSFGQQWELRTLLARFAVAGVLVLAARLLDGGSWRETLRGMGLRRPGKRGFAFLALVATPLLIVAQLRPDPPASDTGSVFGLLRAFSGVDDPSPLPAVALSTLLMLLASVGFLFHQLHYRCRLGFAANVALCFLLLIALPSAQLALTADIELSWALQDFGVGLLLIAIPCWLYVRWGANLWILTGVETAYVAWREAGVEPESLERFGTADWRLPVALLALALGLVLTLLWGRRAEPTAPA